MDVSRRSYWRGRGSDKFEAVPGGELVEVDDAVTNGVGQSTPPAGWYDDPEDPSLLRWWDGFTWGDQKVPRPPTEASRVDAPPPRENRETDQEVTALPDRSGDVADALEAAGLPELEGERAAAGVRPEAPADVHQWAKGAEEAIARAWSDDSPQAWEEAARVARMMADTAHSLAMATKAQRRADLARDRAADALSEVRGLIQEARQARRRAKAIRDVLDEAREENTPTAWGAAVQRIEALNDPTES